jgi:hypothetical protein
MSEGHCLVCLESFPCACSLIRYPGEPDSRGAVTVPDDDEEALSLQLFRFARTGRVDTKGKKS